MSVFNNESTAGRPVAGGGGGPSTSSNSRLAPAELELRPVSSSLTTISVGSIRELKPKRERDWREAFSPPADEDLIETHGCALAREILIHGRIYISAYRLYFKSNILGYKTLLDFPLSSVIAIGPRMTALVIPNSLELIVQGGEVYQFCTLNDRDGTLDILLALWRAQAPAAFAAFVGRKSAEEATELRARAASVSSIRSRSSSIGDLLVRELGDNLRETQIEAVDRSPQHVAPASPSTGVSASTVAQPDEKTALLSSERIGKEGHSLRSDHTDDLPLVDQLLKDSSALALATLAGLLLLTNAYLLFT